MAETWFWGDLHLHQANIIRFTDSSGQLIRPFPTIEEHDQTLIDNHNRLVKPEDRVYFLGDLTMHRKHIPLLAKFNGRKKLIKGNHDIFKLKDYLPYFDDILAYRIYPEHGLIVSHIPVYSGQLEHRFKFNLHGHLHANKIDDLRYINICPEHTNWCPVNFHDLKIIMETRTNERRT